MLLNCDGSAGPSLTLARSSCSRKILALVIASAIVNRFLLHYWHFCMSSEHAQSGYKSIFGGY